MKQAQIVTILAQEFGILDVNELNKLLRQKDAPKTKYRMSGENLGHLGVTGLIKMITDKGLKVIGSTRVNLVLFEDIEKFEKANPRSERSVYTTPKNDSKATLKLLADDEEDDGDYSDLEPLIEKKRRRRPAPRIGKSGSKFIPKEKK